MPTPNSSNPDRSVPKAKQTSLGLYLTAQQAFEKWKADPEKVKVLDVRTPEEHVFVGHPTMAWNVPVIFQTYEWDASGNKLPTKTNPNFLTDVKKLFKPTDTLLVMCRSGDRSAKSVDVLTQAGFKNVYNIIDGMEGDKVDDPASVYVGKRLKNGWKNSGAPWTYDLDPAKMRWPTTRIETRPAKDGHSRTSQARKTP